MYISSASATSATVACTSALSNTVPVPKSPFDMAALMSLTSSSIETLLSDIAVDEFREPEASTIARASSRVKSVTSLNPAVRLYSSTLPSCDNESAS